MNTNKVQYKFSNDRAIRSEKEDLLNRSGFALELASSLSSWNEDDSLVVSLYGNWGDGKTSTKNMLVEAIVKTKGKHVEVLEFNPWQWTQGEKLSSSFFNELKRLLKKRKKTNQAIIKKLEKYSEYLEFGKDVFETAGSSSKDLGTFLSLILAYTSFKTQGWISNFLFGLGVTSLVISHLSRTINTITRLLKLNEKSHTLEDLKKELSDELRKNDKTFLVIIDDIDRLNPEETKQVFTLIKGNADFPKLIYLTMFQRDIVEKSLEINGIYSGRDYLEKIIQVGIALPNVPEIGIHKILFSKLDEALTLHGGLKHFEEARWRQLFNEGGACYFKNLRDVNRFLSSFLFQLGSLYKQNELEVNFIDLIGIEILRLHEPEVYKTLFNNKETLTSSPSYGYTRSGDEERKSKILNILEKATIAKREQVQQILEVLFPNIRDAWSNYHVSVNNEHFVHLRVCHPDRFNRYFSFFLTEKDFSEYEFQKFLDATRDEQELNALFKKYETEGRLNAFIDKLEYFKQSVPATNANPFLKTIFSLGDIVDSEYKGMMQFSTFRILESIVISFLKKKELNEIRGEVYKKAISETNGLTLPVFSLFDEYQRRKADQYPDLFSMRPEEKEIVKGLLLEKIHRFKNTNRLKDSPQISRILSIWKHFEPNEVFSWINEYTKTDEELLSFCRRLVTKSYSTSGYNSKTHYNLSVYYLNEFFVNPRDVLSRILSLKEKFNLPENEHLFKTIKRACDELENPEKFKNRFHHDEEDD